MSDYAAGVLALVATVLIWGGWRAFEAVFWPRGACRRCGGSARRWSPLGVHWRPCPTCEATGWRTRRGRRAYDYVRSRRYR